MGNSAGGPPQKLVPQLQLLRDRRIAFHIRVMKIIQQAAALADHHQKAAARAVVLFVALQVFSQVIDTLREQSDLHVSGTGVLLVQFK